MTISQLAAALHIEYCSELEQTFALNIIDCTSLVFSVEFLLLESLTEALDAVNNIAFRQIQCLYHYDDSHYYSSTVNSINSIIIRSTGKRYSYI